MLNKKNDSIWNKKLLLKYAVLKMIEKKIFLQKMFVWIKDDQDSVTWSKKMKIEKKLN